MAMRPVIPNRGMPAGLGDSANVAITGGSITGVTGVASPPDRQSFTSNGTWTKPTGVFKRVRIVGCGGGGGGGSGRRGAAGTVRAGGAGGSHGSIFDYSTTRIALPRWRLSSARREPAGRRSAQTTRTGRTAAARRPTPR